MGFFNAPVTSEVYKRVILLILLGGSIVFNYILYKDNVWLNYQHTLIKAEFIEDVVGYDYCPDLLDMETNGGDVVK